MHNYSTMITPRNTCVHAQDTMSCGWVWSSTLLAYVESVAIKGVKHGGRSGRSLGVHDQCVKLLPNLTIQQ